MTLYGEWLESPLELTIHFQRFPPPPIFPFPHELDEMTSLTKLTKEVTEVQGRDTQTEEEGDRDFNTHLATPLH